MKLNLILALFWLILGGALLVWPHVSATAPDVTIRGTDISAAWLGVVLGLYNLARWWSTRSYLSQQRALDEARERQERAEEDLRRSRGERDPNFVFTEPPPEPKDKGT